MGAWGKARILPFYFLVLLAASCVHLCLPLLSCQCLPPPPLLHHPPNSQPLPRPYLCACAAANRPHFRVRVRGERGGGPSNGESAAFFWRKGCQNEFVTGSVNLRRKGTAEREGETFPRRPQSVRLIKSHGWSESRETEPEHAGGAPRVTARGKRKEPGATCES